MDYRCVICLEDDIGSINGKEEWYWWHFAVGGKLGPFCSYQCMTKHPKVDQQALMTSVFGTVGRGGDLLQNVAVGKYRKDSRGPVGYRIDWAKYRAVNGKCPAPTHKETNASNFVTEYCLQCVCNSVQWDQQLVMIVYPQEDMPRD